MANPTTGHRPIFRCWSGPARGFLIVAALPLGIHFAAVRPDRTPPARWPDLKVNPNTAPMPVFEALPGLGPALAGRIAEARAARPFASVADLDRRVKGIGPAKAAALGPFLRFPDR